MLDECTTTGLAVVIGAGTMGIGIAAQLANAGWRVRLLDVVGRDAESRNACAEAGLARLARSRPPLLFLPEFISQIDAGNTTDDLACMAGADWVVEAIVENMEAKREIVSKIAEHAGDGTVVTSNTSGLNLSQMAASFPDTFRSRFFGSHFLNPPRYLKLLEVVPTTSSYPLIVAGFIRFAEQKLGHRVVVARDTPGFISTRIWIEHLLESIRLAVESGITVEEADYLTGPLIGRPRSGTFRMADIVGLDVICAIAANQYAALPEDPFRDRLVPPDVLQELVKSGQLGEKTGAGFYRKAGNEILSLDLNTGTYRSRVEPAIKLLNVNAKWPLPERMKAIINSEESPEREYVNDLLDSLHNYVSYVGPLVANDVAAVDNVMKWGFQWEMGPYAIEDLRLSKSNYFADKGGERQAIDFCSNSLKTIVDPPEYVTLAELKSRSRTVLEAPEGALVDMGDGVACIELRTKMNTFGPALCDLFDRARERAERDFLALVVGSDSPNFSAGFNLTLFLEAVPKEDWEGIDGMLRQVQNTFMALKYSSIPSVAAVRGYTLGGGCECAFACSAIQASPELKMGLPELPAGLIPAGGAFKELLFRTFETWDGGSDAFPRSDRAFDFIVAYPNSSSAAHAKKLGLLRKGDAISRNADQLLFDAKQKALELANGRYEPPVKRGVWAVGAEGLARMRMAIHGHCTGISTISEHDRLIADRVAYVMCGGPLSMPQEVSEAYMLNLEREVFLALVREPKTVDRIRHLLETGKPLSN